MKAIFLVFCVLCLGSQETLATDSLSDNENKPPSSQPSIPSKSVASQHGSLAKRVFGNIDTYELAYGPSNIVLKNPRGFDVATQVYDNGEAPSGILDTGSERISAIMYGPFGVTDWSLRRLSLSYDKVDYAGLELRSITGDIGLVAEARHNYARINIGLSLGTGLTRSKSYTDDAIHPLAQVSAHMRISLWRIFLEAVATERINFGSTLDGRTASPRIRNTTLMFGIRFK